MGKKSKPKSTGNKVGRPIVLTEKIRDDIVKAIRLGNYYGPSARFAGVAESTLYHWLDRGRKEPDSIYGEFLREVEKAKNFAEIEAVGFIREAGKADPKHYQWWLERKFPQRWAKKVDKATEAATQAAAAATAAVVKVLLVGTPPPGEKPFDPDTA